MFKSRFTHLLIAIFAISGILALAMKWHATHRQVDGFKLTRQGESIRVSGGTTKAFDVNTETNFRFWLGFDLECGQIGSFPILSKSQDVWMWDINYASVGGRIMLACFINPRNNNSLDQMQEMLNVDKSGNAADDRFTRIAARNYVYLGYVVRNQDDVDSLKLALRNRESVRLDRDIKTPDGVLYRLKDGVANRIAENPQDLDELKRLRGSIPVMFELIDREAGHPCDTMDVLYFDGHFERIKIGDKFPATADFIDSFQPPKLSGNKVSN